MQSWRFLLWMDNHFSFTVTISKEKAYCPFRWVALSRVTNTRQPASSKLSYKRDILYYIVFRLILLPTPTFWDTLGSIALYTTHKSKFLGRTYMKGTPLCNGHYFEDSMVSAIEGFPLVNFRNRLFRITSGRGCSQNTKYWKCRFFFISSDHEVIIVLIKEIKK